MRAHHKAHLNDDKAGKTLKRSMVVIAGVVAASLLWRFVSEYFGSAVTAWLGELKPETLIGPGYAVASMLTFFAVNLSVNRLHYRYSRRNRLFFYCSLVTAVGLAVLAVAAILWVVDGRVNPLWYLFGLPPLLMVAGASRPLGQRHLRYRRRKLPPANYILRYKALTEAGDDTAKDLLHEINTLIRRNSLKVDTLSHREKLALLAIGVEISD